MVDYIFNTSQIDQHWQAMCEAIKPQGRICGIVDTLESVDLNALKRKSATFSWEFMFTRSMYQTEDMIEQRNLLTRIAEWVDRQKIQSTLTETLSPINAANLRTAHAKIEAGHMIGKLVLTGWASGASTSTMVLNLGTAGPIGTAQANGITQFSSSYSTTFVNQNGVQFGNFFGTSIDEYGIVTALFDNGQTLPVYKLPIATFPNPNGLDAKSGTIFSQSGNSGGFVLRPAGTSNAGKIAPSSLEASTSDLAEEFTNMIITQRAYSANTRVITTADEMLDELIRIKR